MRGEWKEGIGRGRDGKGGRSERKGERSWEKGRGKAPLGYLSRAARRVSSYAIDHSCACSRPTYSALFAMG